MGQQIDPQLLAAMISQESGGNPYAVSPAGAMGLMQIMPPTARDPGYGMPNIFDIAKGMGISVPDTSERTLVDLLRNPDVNKAFGQTYYNGMLKLRGGNQDQALAAYNAGPGVVAQYGGVPPFAETQNYVKSIMGPQQQSQPMANVRGPMAPPSFNAPGDLGLAPPAQSAPGIGIGQAEAKTAAAGYPGAEAAGNPMMAQIGKYFQSPMGLPTLMAAVGTDWSSPESIGANAGSVAGTAAATGIPEIAGALGAAAGPVGAVAGGLLGGAVGGLFGDSPEEKAKKKAKDQARKNQILAAMNRTTQMLQQNGYDKRKALNDIARALEPGV